MKKWIGVQLAVIGMLLMTGGTFAQQAMGEVHGYVKNKKTGEGIFGAKVYIKDQDRLYQAKTDPDGGFRISAIPAGEYYVNIQYDLDTMRNIGVIVPMDGIARMGDIAFESHLQVVTTMHVSPPKVALVDGNIPVLKITSDDIKNSPAKFDPKGMLTASSSEIRMTDDGNLVFRGARKGDMLYMIDGIKSRDVGTVPSCAIGNMMVYTGGLPAKYGDTLGGVVVMETKSYFDLYREWYADQLKSGKL